jgi:hypothetical protein
MPGISSNQNSKLGDPHKCDPGSVHLSIARGVKPIASLMAVLLIPVSFCILALDNFSLILDANKW